MRTLETAIPPRGLSIPCVTIVDANGEVLEDDQRRLTRFLIGAGRGADVIFVMGTTGDWNRLAERPRQRAIQVTVEEVRKHTRRGEDPVEAWVGITAPSVAETLATLELALDLDAHAVVVAPLAIRDVSDPVRFLQRDVADFLDARGARIPVYLYDNAEIAAGREVRLRTQWVKQISRLDFVRGIKVSASPRRLGHYTKAARQFRDLGAFGIYVGNAGYIFEMMRPRTGFFGKLAERWNRFLLHDMLPAGVVAGPGNLWPREWQYAWRVSCAGDVERMAELQQLFEQFRASYTFPTGKRSLAALKRGLLRLGVVSSDAVAAGTPPLDAEQARAFDAALEALHAEMRARLPERWCSDVADAADV